MEKLSEGEIICQLDGVLSGLEPAVLQRVMSWANAKFISEIDSKNMPVPQANSASDVGNSIVSEIAGEIPGIARLFKSGQYEFFARDLKANSSLDAAVRLVLVVVHTYLELTGKRAVSSKHIIKPLLENRRIYTGSTREALANYKGVIRKGDSISLDFDATNQAKEYVVEMQDSSFTGSWRRKDKSGSQKHNMPSNSDLKPAPKLPHPPGFLYLVDTDTPW